ncbi:hypothetical protein CF319_g5797 [Tilletia indica]|nr:hypothetical protein CF319_g5797 [Tilletia indica]
MREDNWSPEPVFHWGQLGYEGKNPAGRWQAPTKQLPELGTNIVPPTISALLTFAVNPQHLNYRRSAMIGSEPQSNYTMALLASVGSSYSLAPNLFVSDANFYSMPSSTKVPYRGEKTTKMFESGFAWSLATNISIYILFGGSNKYRFAITHKAELQHAVDMGSTLAAPSIGIQLEGRWRIFLFGPHPCAASCEFPVLKKLPLHTAAFQALHRLAAAIEFIIHAKWPAPPVAPPLLQSGFDVFASTMNRTLLLGAIRVALEGAELPALPRANVCREVFRRIECNKSDEHYTWKRLKALDEPSDKDQPLTDHEQGTKRNRLDNDAPSLDELRSCQLTRNNIVKMHGLPGWLQHLCGNFVRVQ